MSTQNPPLACKRCHEPLLAARVKAPTHGWYCTKCYYAVFIDRVFTDILLTGSHYHEVVHP